MEMKGIIFDFNGTMIFDTEIQERAWGKFLKEKTGREVTEDEFSNQVHGKNGDEIISHFISNEISTEEKKKLSDEKEEMYRNMCMDQKEDFKLVDGLTEFLDYLKSSEIKFTIATASDMNNVKFFFDNLELHKWFDIQKVVCNDGQIKGKPDPEIYNQAMEHLELPSNECIIFEDSKSGIESAARSQAGRIVRVCEQDQLDNLEEDNRIYKTISNYNNMSDILSD